MTTTRSHFTFRIDTWTADGESVIEHVAGAESGESKLVVLRAACEYSVRTTVSLYRLPKILIVDPRCSQFPSRTWSVFLPTSFLPLSSSYALP